MTENERRLREWLANNGGEALAWLPGAFDAMLAVHRSASRAEALEEAAQYAGLRVYDGWHEAKNNHDNPREALAQYVMDSVRTLITTPAPAPAARCACGEPRAHHDSTWRIVKFNGGNTLALCVGFRAKVSP